jgi:hypothetical protein
MDDKVEPYTGVDVKPSQWANLSQIHSFLMFRETQSIDQSVYGCIDTNILIIQ